MRLEMAWHEWIPKRGGNDQDSSYRRRGHQVDNMQGRDDEGC